MILCITPGCACTAKTAYQVDLYSAADGRIAENVVSRRGNQPGQRALVRPDDRRPILRFCTRGGQPWNQKKKKETDEQTEKEREREAREEDGGRWRVRSFHPHRWNATTRLCLSLLPPFSRSPVFFLFRLLSSTFSHPVAPMGFDGGLAPRRITTTSKACTETAAEVGRCSLEISTLGHYWGLV